VRVVTRINDDAGSIFVAKHDTVELPPFERREFCFELLEGFRGLFGNRLSRLPYHIHHGGILHRHYGVGCYSAPVGSLGHL
jgi:hypothetical protein